MTAPEVARPRLRPANLFLLISLVAWCGWVLLQPLPTGRAVAPTSPYLVAPVFLVIGLVAGRILALGWRTWLAVPLAVAGLVVLVLPIYANAQGAVGVQFVALAGLALLTGMPRADGVRAANLFASAVGLLGVGMLLAARSDASAALALPLAVLVALVLGHRIAPPRRVTATFGVAILALAALAVVVLAVIPEWPDRLNQGTSLSRTRHILWRDALRLWAANPFTGGGPGSFTENSELASSTASLAMVHSSVLQVGSELGLVGFVLFVAVIAAGIAVASDGGRAAALVGVAAWAALGVHSVIDHLYEFRVVTLAAGLVVGWAGTRSRESRTPLANEGRSWRRIRDSNS